MDNRQAPIGSGFGARTTAEEVLSGMRLTGKTAIVTGGHSGLGLETTRALAYAGARVVVAARRAVAAREAVGNIEGIEIDELDLSDLDSVRGFADRFLASDRHADILINNAGIMACPETRIGPVGSPVRNQSSRTLRTCEPTLAGSCGWCKGRIGLFRRPPYLRDSLGRH